MISLQRNFFSPCQICTEEDFKNIVESEKTRATMRSCREVCAQILQEENAVLPDENALRALKDRYSRLKKSLPMLVFQATFPLGRRRQEDARLNGLFMVDFDHIDPWRELRRIHAALCGGEEGPQWKEELARALDERMGLMLLHITPSGRGLRMVARAEETLDLAGNQLRLAQALGLPHDEACKDASRCSFAVGSEEIIYLNPQLFTYDNKDYEARYGEAYRRGVCGTARPAKEAAVAAERRDDNAPAVAEFRGLAYSRILDEWWRQHGGEPVEGDRNVKLQKLAANLRYICDNRPERLLELMPRYGLSDQEVGGLVQRACAYAFHQNVPREMQQVLDALQGRGGEDMPGGEEVYARLMADFDTRLRGLKLPPVLRAVTAGVDSNLRVGALLASLPMFYTLLSRVRFRHYDGSECRLSGMTFVVGPAASGKSFIRELDTLLMESLRAKDTDGRRAEEEYRQAKELNKNKKEQMKRPAPVIRIVPSQVSNTNLAERMRNAYDAAQNLHLHCYTVETELATALRAAKGGSWIEKNDIYCKSFHNELWGMDYANDQAINGEIQVNLNLVISGTEDAFDKLIPTGTILSGLPTRIMYFPMPIERFKMLDRRRISRTEAQKQELRDASHALADAGGWVEAEPVTEALYQWCARQALRAKMEDDVELDDLRKRASLIGIRAGVAYGILSRWREYVTGRPVVFGKDAVRFGLFVADYCLATQYAKFAHRMREQKKRVQEYSGVRERTGKHAETYLLLRDRFTTQDAQSILNTDATATYTQLSRWQKKGFIKRLKQGFYEKVVKDL